jgi:hypothetical protein
MVHLLTLTIEEPLDSILEKSNASKNTPQDIRLTATVCCGAAPFRSGSALALRRKNYANAAPTSAQTPVVCLIWLKTI